MHQLIIFFLSALFINRIFYLYGYNSPPLGGFKKILFDTLLLAWGSLSKNAAKLLITDNVR